jgi:hypothetical protein
MIEAPDFCPDHSVRRSDLILFFASLTPTALCMCSEAAAKKIRRAFRKEQKGRIRNVLDRYAES